MLIKAERIYLFLINYTIVGFLCITCAKISNEFAISSVSRPNGFDNFQFRYTWGKNKHRNNKWVTATAVAWTHSSTKPKNGAHSGSLQMFSVLFLRPEGAFSNLSWRAVLSNTKKSPRWFLLLLFVCLFANSRRDAARQEALLPGVQKASLRAPSRGWILCLEHQSGALRWRGSVSTYSSKCLKWNARSYATAIMSLRDNFHHLRSLPP